ncbi:asparaginase [Helicobacter kayseriensis]|nr:asparaginase [Helicobacter kayseriensis]MCE3048486.1 asparaginase [Helicobacter kayseriensis]
MDKNFSRPMPKTPLMPNKKILILTTGGTIAGSGDDHLKGSSYQAGALNGETLLSLLPSIQETLEVQEIAQIDSVEITPHIWKMLLESLHSKALEYDGFVITHGTDTMEESAFALDLLYKKDKPVVLVGAMRPSNALGSDGMKNLCNGIALASQSPYRGVMVLMNDKIYNPHTLYKAHTYNLDAFASRNGGEIGYVLDGCVKFFYHPLPSIPLPFEPQDLESLPKVEIVYLYAGIEELPQFSHKVDGLVIAGCGAGNIPSKIKSSLLQLQDDGIKILACTRGSQGFVTQSDFIPAYGLSVPKARILLALCLKHSFTQEAIQEIFSHF